MQVLALYEASPAIVHEYHSSQDYKQYFAPSTEVVDRNIYGAHNIMVKPIPYVTGTGDIIIVCERI